MASTNLILAVPTANSSVNYDLPANDSAKLSFSPEDIDGLGAWPRISPSPPDDPMEQA